MKHYVKTYGQLSAAHKALFDKLIAEYKERFTLSDYTRKDFLMAMTPNPYVVQKQYVKDDTLATKVQEFYALLATLKIPLKEAREQDYTLNLQTGDKLYSKCVLSDRRNRYSDEQKQALRAFKF